MNNIQYPLEGSSGWGDAVNSNFHAFEDGIDNLNLNKTEILSTIGDEAMGTTATTVKGAIAEVKGIADSNTTSLNAITNQITTKQLTSGTDLNSIKTPDVKYFTKGNSDARTMLNIPYDSVVSFSLEFFKTTDSDVNYGFQTLREYNGNMWIRALQDGIWLSWKQVVTTNAIKSDTGWINLTLINGVTTYNGVSQYRRIGNVVFIRGLVTNISTIEVIIATLPTGFRPSKTHSYINYKNGYQPIALRINGDGSIYVSGSTNGVYTSEHFYNIDTSFLVD